MHHVGILAIDPGETTGWFMAWVRSGDTVSTSIATKSWGTVYTFEELEGIYENTFQRAMYVVLEAYVVYPAYAAQHTGSRLLTSQMLGVCKWLTWKAGATKVVQLAITARNHWPTSRIRKYLPDIQMFPSTPTPVAKGAMGSHEVSALRHWLTFVERRELITFDLIREEDIV